MPAVWPRPSTELSGHTWPKIAAVLCYGKTSKSGTGCVPCVAGSAIKSKHMFNT